MSLLAELFKQLETIHCDGDPQQDATLAAPLNTGVSVTAPTALFRPDEKPCQPNATTDAAGRRAAWHITLGGKQICSMVGYPITYSDALAAARWRWPEADILETP